MALAGFLVTVFLFLFTGFLVVVVVVVVVLFLKLSSGILTGDLNSGYFVALGGVVVEDQERLGAAVEPVKYPLDVIFVVLSDVSSQNDTVSDISGGTRLL